MISRDRSSEYICTKNNKHREVSMAGQKSKKCWLCHVKMEEKGSAVITKGFVWKR